MMKRVMGKTEMTVTWKKASIFVSMHFAQNAIAQ